MTDSPENLLDHPSTGTIYHFPIVGIGASAGGLEAFSELLEQIPSDPGMALVVIQHLDPHHESLLTEILAGKTPLSIRLAADGDVLEANRVYVIAPDTNLMLDQGRLRTTPRGHRSALFMPIDVFFRSLAAEAKERAVAVLLSGGGTDGTLGMAEVKGAGGITLAQDPTTARQDSMPRSAIAANCVDLIRSPAQLGEELTRLGRQATASDGREASLGAQAEAPPLEKLFSLLARSHGVDFSQYKKSTVCRRIHRRMSLLNISTLEDYIGFLQDHTPEVEALYQDLLIRVTSFFRDPEAYQALVQKVLPELLINRGSGTPLRIWVAGCATGEEVYSIAITLLEQLGDMVNNLPIKILASDVNEFALAQARKGIYIDNIALDVSPERLRRFFVKINNSFQVSQSVRDLCVFSRHHVACDTPFANLDLVTCRNVLIYMDRPMQKRVLPLLHYSLKPGGYLMLGTAESISGYESLFATIDSNCKIFRKIQGPSGAHLDFGPRRGQQTRAGAGPVLQPGTWRHLSDSLDVQKDAERILLNRYVPAGVTIDEALTVLHFHGQVGTFFRPAAGSATLDLTKMVHEELADQIRSAVAIAKETGRAFTKEGLRFSDSRRLRSIELEVIPLRSQSEQPCCFLVLFKEPLEHAIAAASSVSPAPSDSARGSRVEQLEQELEAVRGYLQSLIQSHEATNEELKAANEEILSSNEELQSTNDELQTSKEEMQSTNEELATVNDELKYRNAELAQLNDDLSNLFDGLNIPVVIVNRELRIRRFTHPAEQLFNLINSDVGRPIGNLRHQLDIPDLERMITDVINSLEGKEMEVKDASDRWWLLRIRPYVTCENRIDGAAISVLDIDVLKRNAEHLRVASDYANAIVETICEPLVVLDQDLVLQRANAAFYQTFRLTPQEAYQQRFMNIGGGLWGIPELQTQLESLQSGGGWIREWEFDVDIPSVGGRTFALNGHRIQQDGGVTGMILLALQDVTARKRELAHSTQLAKEQAARAEAEAANRMKDEFLAMLAHELRNPLAPVRNTLYILRQRVQGDALVQHALELSERQISHMARLLDDLLDVSRITRGQIQLRREIVDLKDAVEDAVQSSRSLMESRNHRLIVSLPEEPIYLEADRARLEQILSNLLNNAAKYTDPGGEVSLQVAQEKREVLIRIRDTGIGMSPAVLPKIFELFAQAHRSIDRSQGGLGIGLTLVKRLVELHGGTIEAASEGEGRGSEFLVRLPLRVSEALDLPVGASLLAGTQPLPQRVLIVDDNEDAARTLAILMQGQGHRVEVAHDGPSALEKAEAFHPQCVVLDIGLPGMTGYEVAQKMRQRAELRNTVLIAVTGFGQEEDRQRSREAGIDHHFVKPVDISKLSAVLAVAAPREGNA